VRSFFKKEVKEAGNLVMEKFQRDKRKYLKLNNKTRLPSKKRSQLMNSAFLVAIRTKFGCRLTTKEFSKVKSLIGKDLNSRKGNYPKPPPKKEVYVSKVNVKKEKLTHTTTEIQTDLFPNTISTPYY